MHHHKRLEQVSSDDFFKARYRWNLFWFQQNRGYPPLHWMDFEYFLGAKRMPYGSTMLIRRSAARKIRLLVSDHYKTVLLIYKARKELQ